MKKDIVFPEYKELHLAICPGETPDDLWSVFIINQGQKHLKNLMVSSSGYGENEKGEKIQTSTLRHFFDDLSPENILEVEKIDPGVFNLTNEYWLSYYIGLDLFDRRFLFVPDSLKLQNCVSVALLQKQAVLHA